MKEPRLASDPLRGPQAGSAETATADSESDFGHAAAGGGLVVFPHPSWLARIDPMRRREFIALLGGAAAWPLAARAQQPAPPVIGFLGSSSPANRARLVTAFRQGIRETGYVEGQNVAIEYRWAQDQADRLPDLAADLVRRQVTVIAAHDTPSSIVAKAATTTIPIVFAGGADPVRLGLVASINRLGGNVTGISASTALLGAKQLGLLRELRPGAARIAVLADPKFPLTERFVSEVRAAASAVGQQIDVLDVSSDREMNTAFTTLVQMGLTRCTWASARSCFPNGNGLSRWRPDIGFPRSIHGAKPSLLAG
jgi:hypothetical protein